MKAAPDEAIVLAGGRGERLRPFTYDRPKPMVEVGDQPLLLYTLRWLKSSGVERVIIACNYKHDAISDYFGDGNNLGLDISYSIEEKSLGRGGAIKLASGHLKDLSSNVLVINGDVVTNLSLSDLSTYHNNRKANITIVCVPLRSPYGIVKIDQNGLATGFREKPVLDHWINAGIYLINGALFDSFPPYGEHEETLFPTLAAKKELHAYKFNGFWRTVDTGKDLEELNKEDILSNWV